MSDLAFNLSGDPFEVPPNATRWRVRRMKQKGAPEVVYGRNGQPLVLPIEAELDDVRAEVSMPGRYRFDPIDDDNKPIEGAPPGYAYIHDHATAPPSIVNALPTPSDNVVIEAMRMNAEISRTVVERFPQMLEAAAVLLRAADGAGLPARPPMATDGEDDDDDGDEDAGEASGLDVNALLAQFVPLLVAGLASGKMKVPNLASLLDWRKAQPSKPKATTAAIAATPDAAPEPVDTKVTDVPRAVELPPLDAATMQHFIAVQAALTPDEATLARAVAAELSPV
jgi:hypothetical protein